MRILTGALALLAGALVVVGIVAADWTLFAVAACCIVAHGILIAK